MLAMELNGDIVSNPRRSQTKRNLNSNKALTASHNIMEKDRILTIALFP